MQRQRKKFIRKLANNTHKDSLKPSNNDNNRDNNINDKNTHNENTSLTAQNESSVASTPIKPTRRRIVVPIRRTRLPSNNDGNKQNQSDHVVSNESSSTTSKPLKRKMIVMRRRLPTKPAAIDLNEASSSQSIVEAAPTVLTETIFDTITTTTTKLRTYTILVTRVHDQHSEIISSTNVREQIKTITDVITRTQLETPTIKPTRTIRKFVHKTTI